MKSNVGGSNGLVTSYGYLKMRLQIGVHGAPPCVLVVLEILCSSTKLTLVLMLSAWCVFHMFGCALPVYHLKSL